LCSSSCATARSEGGTGAAPLVFSDHVALPFKLGFSAVYRTFAEGALNEKLVFIDSGRLGFPAQAKASPPAQPASSSATNPTGAAYPIATSKHCPH
jgi:hypothetical protein